MARLFSPVTAAATFRKVGEPVPCTPVRIRQFQLLQPDTEPHHVLELGRRQPPDTDGVDALLSAGYRGQGDYSSPYYRSRGGRQQQYAENATRQSLRAMLGVVATSDRKSSNRRGRPTNNKNNSSNQHNHNNGDHNNEYDLHALTTRSMSWPEISVPTNSETWDAVSRLTVDSQLGSRNSSNRSILSSINCPRLDDDESKKAKAKDRRDKTIDEEHDDNDNDDDDHEDS